MILNYIFNSGSSFHLFADWNQSVWHSNSCAEEQKCFICWYYRDEMLKKTRNDITINDALCHDRGMFVHFMMMPQHIHLSPWSSVWSQRRLPSCHSPNLAQWCEFVIFPKFKKFLAGCRYRSRVTLASLISKGQCTIYQITVLKIPFLNKRTKLKSAFLSKRICKHSKLTLTIEKNVYEEQQSNLKIVRLKLEYMIIPMHSARRLYVIWSPEELDINWTSK